MTIQSSVVLQSLNLLCIRSIRYLVRPGLPSKTSQTRTAEFARHMTMEDHHGHDTHAMPPQAICNLYKRYQKMDDAAIDNDIHVVDFRRGLTEQQREKIVAVDTVPSGIINQAQKDFKATANIGCDDLEGCDHAVKDCTIYEHKDFPGLRLYPSLLPPTSQVLMLDSVLHRDLSDPLHKTNLHADYQIPYPPALPSSSHPSSFFTYPPASKHEIYTPLNPHSTHKPLNTTQFLGKRLRWLTLGEQYDWSTRSYPPSSPTPFPSDMSSLVTTLFDNKFRPESGVVLLYGTKDFMPVHRDVSEQCQRGLASFTVGCDGLFIVSREEEHTDKSDEEREMCMQVLRVRSGDVVWMGGETRWCWHAMPKIMAGTCPEWLQDWPVGGGGERRREFERWRGFMKGRRLNISCRQVWG